jgi:hypothetical protein
MGQGSTDAGTCFPDIQYVTATPAAAISRSQPVRVPGSCKLATGLLAGCYWLATKYPCGK